MFRSHASVTIALLAAFGVAGCSEKDAIDTTADYGILQGTLDVGNLTLDAELKRTASAEFALPQYKAATNQCLDRRYVHIAGWGPTLSIGIERVCDFVANYDGDGKFTTVQRFCPLAGGTGKAVTVCFPPGKGSAVNGSFNLSMEGTVLLNPGQNDTEYGDNFDGRECKDTAKAKDCDEDPPTGLWLCSPPPGQAAGAPIKNQCRRRLQLDLETSCDNQDPRLIIGTASISITGAKAGLSFTPDCKADDNIESFKPGQACSVDGDCEGGTCLRPAGSTVTDACTKSAGCVCTPSPLPACETDADCSVGHCTRPAAMMSMEACDKAPGCNCPDVPADRCGTRKPVCHPVKAQNCDDPHRPGVALSDNVPDCPAGSFVAGKCRCPSDPDGESQCVPTVTPQECHDSGDCSGALDDKGKPYDADCVDDPDADPSTPPAMVKKYCVDRYRCLLRSVPITNGCGCFASSCIEFTACK